MLVVPHIPVLYTHTLDAFTDIKSGVIIDCTLGYAGHSSMILDSNPKITLIGIDQDQSAIDFSTSRLFKYGNRAIIKKGRFSNVIKEIINEYGVKNIKGILADIGVSSLQLDQKDRGFSYDSDNLDMRMDKDSTLRAEEVINTYSNADLEKILIEYGELRNYKKIASAIVTNRPFTSAKTLSDTLKPLLPQGKKIHPATLLMQAIRIEVNDELGELKSLLKTIKDSNFIDTKVAIISFHSLEDRIVKQTFTSWSKKCICQADAMRCECSKNNDIGKILSKKPIIATNEELKENVRSRSAKMRVFHIGATA
jgi:16S rRNA (cytosine1402-N4)-methyltransferase